MSISVELRSFTNSRAVIYFGDFDSNLELSRRKMATEVVKTLLPFLMFARTFCEEKAHNMLACVLDPHFKKLQCVIDYVGPKKAKAIGAQYNSQVLVPYLVNV